MALAPVAFLSVPYEDFAGYYLKFFLQGTTTPVSMATDSGGITTVDKAEISSGGTVPIGFIKTAGDVIFIPYLSVDYDAWLFPTSAEADANDTSNAVQIADNVNTLGSNVIAKFSTVASMVASAFVSIGDIIDTIEYSDGNGGGNRYEVVAAGTGTDDGGSFIDLATHQAQALFPYGDITLRQFGAKPGSTDSATAINNALDYASGKTLTGENRAYRMDSVFTSTAEKLVFKDADLDVSNITDQGGSIDHVITFQGTQGTSTDLTGDSLTGSSVIAVTSATGLAPDQYAWLSSNAVFESGSTVLLGQVVQIESISSLNVTVYTDILYDFNTSDTATLAPLTLKQNIRLQNINVLGSDANSQAAFLFDKCEDVKVDNCDFELLHYAGIVLNRCVNTDINSADIRYAHSSGLSYGVVVGNGCYGTKVHNGYGEDLRHYVTVGDDDGVNLFTQVSDNHITACRDAGVDAHSAADFMTIDGNTIECASVDDGSADGITFQGLNASITNNTLVGFRRHSIFAQHLPALGTASVLIDGNAILTSGGSGSVDTGIRVSCDTSTLTVNGVTISNNTVRGTNEVGIYIFATGGNLENIVISGNSLQDTTSRGIYLDADSTFTIDRAAISGNTLEGSGTEGIYLFGTATTTITNVSVTGNTVDGFTKSLRCIEVDTLAESGNLFLNFTDPYEFDTTPLNITLDSAKNFPVITVTNATFTLEEHNEFIICNRASTITLTLPTPSIFINKTLTIKTIQAQTVVSANSNVVPAGSASAGTAILAASDGSSALLRSDGTNWITMQTN